MHRIIDWIKHNKLLTLLLAFVLYKFVAVPILFNTLGTNYSGSYNGVNSIMSADIAPLNFGGTRGKLYMPSPVPNNVPPQPSVTDRKIATDVSMSLLVENVSDTANKVVDLAVNNGGYLVNLNTNTGESGSNSTVTVRIPANQTKIVIEQLRAMSVRVVSENISGYDITDQYVDYDAKLEGLNNTKTRFLDILNKAVTVDEILRVQQAINDNQTQIDDVKGQLKYLGGISSTALFTVSISTDELSLPYSSNTPWRPMVIIKNAVRSLMSTFRIGVNASIWIVVYSIIWIPALIVYKIVRRIARKKSPNKID